MTVRARQDLVAARVAMANQLRAHLQTTLPGAIGLFRDIDSPITLRFLTRFPSQDKADWLSPTRLGNWLRSVGYNNRATSTGSDAHLPTHPAAPPAPKPRPTPRSPWPWSPPWRAARADQRPRGPDRATSSRPSRRRDLHLTAPLGHRPRGPATRRDRRRPRTIPHSRSPGLPGRRGTLDPAVRQGQGRRLPLGRRQTTPRRRHRLRRRLPPRQPLGRRPLPPSPRPRPRPPPRRTHPRPRLAARHLALLARRRPLRPRQTPRPTTHPQPAPLDTGLLMPRCAHDYSLQAGPRVCESLRLVTVTEPGTHEDISPVASGQL